MGRLITICACAASLIGTALMVTDTDAAPVVPSRHAVIAEIHRPVIRTACGAPGLHCRPGWHWVCHAYGRCQCERC